MTIFLLLNSLLRMGIMFIVMWKLTHYRKLLNNSERIGMGIAGGSAMLTIPSIWRVPESPFEGWAAALFSLGIFIYFIGRMTRHWRHERNNELMRRLGRTSGFRGLASWTF